MSARWGRTATLGALASLAVLIGCWREKVQRPDLASTAVGPRLEALWNAHGGLKTWQRFAAASFRLEVTVRGRPPRALDVLLPTTALKEVRIARALEPAAAGAHPAPGSRWVRIVYSSLPDSLEDIGDVTSIFDSLDPAEAQELRFVVDTLYYLFQFPFALSRGDWSLRILLAPPTAAARVGEEFYAQSIRPHAGVFLVRQGDSRPEGSDQRALLREVLFANQHHPAFPAGVYKARFFDYSEVQGISVSLRREIVRLKPTSEREPPDPLRPFAPPPSEEAETLVVEELRDVRFLTPKELEQLLAKP